MKYDPGRESWHGSTGARAVRSTMQLRDAHPGALELATEHGLLLQPCSGPSLLDDPRSFELHAPEGSINIALIIALTAAATTPSIT